MKKLIILAAGLTVILLLVAVLSATLFVGVPGLVVAQEEVEVPFLAEWQSSGHADAAAEAFVHWDEETPAEVPTGCAKCHSTPGYLDYLGADESAAGAVDKAAPIGTTVECVACHNEVTLTKTSVVMPSGIELTELGDESRCMECHQGRQSTVSVNEALTEAAVADEDTVSEELGFLNIHYFAAAATKYGTLAKGGYEYEGKTYDGNFAHVAEFDTCIECHNMHTLQVKVEACSGCHEGVTSVEDLKDVRMQGSLVDYDGDGNTDEGIYYELEGLREMLYKAIQAYGTEKSKAAIAYTPDAHPYFYLDANKNGKVDEAEANGDNAYNAWTPRLLKAAYNYQTSIKDPGAFAHGGKYIIELLYDSTDDLNGALSKPIDLSKAHRIDHGHFAGSEEAFRHWDAEGEVPGTCSKCHSGGGLPILLENGLPKSNSVAQPLANGLQCSTCHSDLTTFTIREVATVEFPSGAMIDSGDPQLNLCMECHQGRESTVSVNKAIETSGAADDEVSDKLGFRNVHYFAAGATLFGNEVQGAYQYEGQEYVGRNEHIEEFDSCVECHDTHRQTVQFEACGDCHDVAAEEDLLTIRESSDDFDGDGDTTEGMAMEIDTMREALYQAIQAAAKKSDTAIVYDPGSYPYFFLDANGNGQADPDEVTRENGYKAWTPRLLKAAYNYQYSQKDPGAFAHNGLYVLQFLYDSIEDVGGDVSGMTRP
ncbi:MAG: hypothetical protein AB1801_13000 [Chloroflexota bacterium]